MTRKYFGTDGIRGRVGVHPITPDFLLRLGWAAGRVFASRGNSLILIGKDTRISGYMCEAVLEAGLSSAGVDVRLLGPMPTPGVAYLTRTLRADAGIVISASHNPYYDNGIKFFDHQGNKLDDEVELAIEAELEKPMLCVDSDRLGKAQRVPDAHGRYIEFCKATVDRGFSLKGLNIVLDCAHGATYDVAPGVFTELGASVDVIAAQPDGLNINDGCGSTQPQALCDRVVSTGADLGIALDGDGDRVIMVDHTGRIIDGDEMLFLIADHRAKQGTLVGGVVGTVMSNLGVERAFKARDIAFHRSLVGDRYVLMALRERGWELGGESSGHLICLDLQTTGDGIVSALQALVPLVRGERTLAECTSEIERIPQVMVNVAVDNPAEAAVLDPVLEAVKKAEAKLGDMGRVLLRPSGTEPVVRVMIEGQDMSEIDTLAHEVADVVRLAVR
ncbi:MAG: phosphoglucosamine mutase [Pseudomonadales bacterium]|nr:phosphoglucosamine mutase [Pseudomonadales bacterium]